MTSQFQRRTSLSKPRQMTDTREMSDFFLSLDRRWTRAKAPRVFARVFINAYDLFASNSLYPLEALQREYARCRTDQIRRVWSRAYLFVFHKSQVRFGKILLVFLPLSGMVER